MTFGHSRVSIYSITTDQPNMASRADPSTVGTQRRIEIEQGESAIVSVRPADNEVDVERDGTRWTFSVESDYRADLIEIYDDGPTTRSDVPEWVEIVLVELGVEGVDA